LFTVASKVPKQNLFGAYLRAMYYQVEGNCPTQKIKNVEASWGTLSPQEQAKWAVQAKPPSSDHNQLGTLKVAHRSGEAATASLRVKRKLVTKIPKQNPYSVFMKEMYHQVEGNSPSEKIKSLGALWRTFDPLQKAVWVVRAQSPGVPRNVCVVPPQRLPNSRSLFFKAKIAEVLAGRPQERMRRVAAQWSSLSSEEKAVWNKRAVELREDILQKAPQAPKLRSGYQVFITDRFHVVGEKMSHVAAAWKAADPEVRRTYVRRAAELNMSAAAGVEGSGRRAPSSPRRLSSINLFVKEKYSQAPAGRPPERMRHVGLQWTALSSEEKAIWASKARELRESTLQQSTLDCV